MPLPLERWTWPQDDALGICRLRSDLDEHGVALFHLPDALDEGLASEPFVERILGQRPLRMASALIKPQPDEMKATALQRRAYPMNAGPALLHVDSPAGGPVPPQLQIMICRRPAGEGGASTILDMWRLLDKIATDDPALYRDAFEVSRTVYISGKPHRGPLLARRREQLVLLYGASIGTEVDLVAARLRRWIEAEPLVEFRAERGDVYVNNNHRTLHGRRGFTDTSREFLRLLVWPSVPLRVPARLLERARAAA
jgi:Taurine catabolism dioxygenase TauD, TfdA family